MKMIEPFMEEINNHIKNQTGERIEQNCPRPKDGNKNKKEITNVGKTGDGNPRKEISSYRCKHHQPITRDRKENLRQRRYHRIY